VSKGATLFEVIYLDTNDSVPVLVGVGDAVIAAEWAKEQYPYPEQPDLAGKSQIEATFIVEEYRFAKAEVELEREHYAGLYACFLGAQRAKLRETDHDWLYWLQRVTIPDDSSDDGEPAEGESDRPSSEA
jgi:hypothetical protein